MRALLIVFIFSWSSVSNGDPLFLNSVVSHDIDLIKPSDSNVVVELAFVGRESKEMPDKRTDELFDEQAYVFELLVDDGANVGVWLHSDFGSRSEAEEYAAMLISPIGNLSKEFREVLSHVVVHKGDEVAFSEHLGHFFVLYSENMITRLRNNDLEETVFHESVHAVLDHKYADAPEWLEAQEKDGEFVTEYARERPAAEDLAESAVFVRTLLTHPDRLPRSVKTWLENNIPNRILFLAEVLDIDV